MPKILIAISVYDRFGNLKRWVDSWNQSEQSGATLAIIHNYDAPNEYWKSYCEANGAIYIHRENIGFGTGVFQDIIMGRLCQDIDWDIILFSTDDIFPMRKTFLREFADVLNLPHVGIACMEISDVVTTHVRTGGFMLRKEVTDKLYFNVDPVVTEEDGWHFEHKGGGDTFTNQVLKMGLRILPVTESLGNSPVWDSHVRGYLDRWEEFYREFGIKTI